MKEKRKIGEKIMKGKLILPKNVKEPTKLTPRSEKVSIQSIPSRETKYYVTKILKARRNSLCQ